MPRSSWWGHANVRAFRGHTCQAWSVAIRAFGDMAVKPGAWLHVSLVERDTEAWDGGWSRQRRGLEREKEVWTEGRSVAQPPRPECLPGSHPFPGGPAPAWSFPSSGTVFLTPDGGSVSPPWTAASKSLPGMSFLLLPLPTLSLSLCLPEAGSWPQASEVKLCPLTPLTSAKAPRRVP